MMTTVMSIEKKMMEMMMKKKLKKLKNIYTNK
jgi:hypothetical protein